VKTGLVAAVLFTLSSSCQQRSFLSPSSQLSLPDVQQVDPTLSPLVWLGSIGILGGLILMTVSRIMMLPMRGQLPLLVGIGLVLLTYTIQKYDQVLILPAAITSGLLAAVAVFMSFKKLRKTLCPILEQSSQSSSLPTSSEPQPGPTPGDG
jgi:hypothetical protein